ncbi:hypothetical protein WN943_003378 [Citrus x changshan-huyou]
MLIVWVKLLVWYMGGEVAMGVDRLGDESRSTIRYMAKLEVSRNELEKIYGEMNRGEFRACATAPLALKLVLRVPVVPTHSFSATHSGCDEQPVVPRCNQFTFTICRQRLPLPLMIQKCKAAFGLINGEKESCF